MKICEEILVKLFDVNSNVVGCIIYITPQLRPDVDAETTTSAIL